ncbi:AMP-binding protein [Streptomyces sp. NPDC029674]|uniref:AMP-binding protein n=1 Tax=Streptomyces sp. NPDC029674 TaxID=3365297 RepID=UPI00384BE85A
MVQPSPEDGFRSPAETLLDALGRHPDRVVLVYGERRVTARELRGLTFRAARVLASRGVHRGDTVTLLTGNAPEGLAVTYAADLLGCRVAALYEDMAARAQGTVVRDVETRALVVAPHLIAPAVRRHVLPHAEEVYVLGPDRAEKDLLALAADHSAAPLPGRARPEDIRAIQHTGGTTGHPKGVCLSFGRPRSFPLPRPVEPHRLLVSTPLAHLAGMAANTVLAHGGQVVLHDGFDPAAVLRAVADHRITLLFLLPPQLHQLTDHPDAARTDTSSLRVLMYSGCTAAPTRIADAVRRFGPVLVQNYGQNEAGALTVLTSADHDPARPERLGTVGTPLPGVQLSIRDGDDREVPTGRRGEVCVRTPSLMEGYWKRPELTAQVLRDGWLHTGDLGFVDDSGYLTITGRLKDMIVVVGGHVYPAELEHLLDSHPRVLHSTVVGVPGTDRTEHVHAFVVPAPGGVSEAELRTLVRDTYGAMYVPARVHLVPTIPRTAVGKPDTDALRRQASVS